MSRSAALKAWQTRRSRMGSMGLTGRARKAQILTTGRRAMATNRGGRARSGPVPTSSRALSAALRASLRKPSSSGLGSLFHKRGLMMAHAMRQVAEIGAKIKARKHRRGGMAEASMYEWSEYAVRTAKDLAHQARGRRRP